MMEVAEERPSEMDEIGEFVVLRFDGLQIRENCQTLRQLGEFVVVNYQYLESLDPLYLFRQAFDLILRDVEHFQLFLVDQIVKNLQFHASEYQLSVHGELLQQFVPVFLWGLLA